MIQAAACLTQTRNVPKLTECRVAVLDGWCGMAILFVLIDHLQAATLHRYARSWTQTGQHGVLIFFVLSGYLITTNLLKTDISLKGFYIRRFFRLMPAAWAYLGVLLALDYLIGAHLTNRGDLVACLFFYRNFHIASIGNVDGHFWSLSIEEHFYFVWPTVLWLLGPAKSRWAAVLIAIAGAGYRWLAWSPSFGQVSLQTQFHLDTLLVGCVLALALPSTKPELLTLLPVAAPIRP